MEKVTFNAAYPNDRVVVYLFLPDQEVAAAVAARDLRASPVMGPS